MVLPQQRRIDEYFVAVTQAPASPKVGGDAGAALVPSSLPDATNANAHANAHANAIAITTTTHADLQLISEIERSVIAATTARKQKRGRGFEQQDTPFITSAAAQILAWTNAPKCSIP